MKTKGKPAGPAEPSVCATAAEGADGSGGGHGSDVCECGDYRCQHDTTGRCRVCSGSRAPYDGCVQFRLSRAANASELEHWQLYYGWADSPAAQPGKPVEKRSGSGGPAALPKARGRSVGATIRRKAKRDARNHTRADKEKP